MSTTKIRYPESLMTATIYGKFKAKSLLIRFSSALSGLKAEQHPLWPNFADHRCPINNVLLQQHPNMSDRCGMSLVGIQFRQKAGLEVCLIRTTPN